MYEFQVHYENPINPNAEHLYRHFIFQVKANDTDTIIPVTASHYVLTATIWTWRVYYEKDIEIGVITCYQQAFYSLV